MTAPTERARGLPRVVHVPGDHDYVRHATTLPVAAPAPAAAAPRPAERFVWRDGVAWLARHGADVDVLHVHFGFEQVDVDTFDAVLAAAARADVAVVWTAHDLTNPHLVDQAPHQAQLAVLARQAAGVITLTPGAAAEVERRWDRRPVVVGHPHLAPVDVLARTRPGPTGRAGRVVVGVPLGLLRPATDPAVVRSLLDPAVSQVLPVGAVLRVTLREEVLAPGFPRPDAGLFALLRAAHDDGRVELAVGPRTPDAALWEEIAALSALVLPYRWGSHSGWVESCHDVGTPVVAPALGHWGEQQAVHAFTSGPDGTGGTDRPSGPDPVSLGHALAAALVQGPRRESVLDERLHEREASVAEHARLHALAAAGGRW